MNRNIKLLVMLLCAASCTLAQKKTVMDTISSTLIDSSLNTYAESLSLQLIKDLGLKNKQELKSLKPAYQFKFFMIDVGQLKKYKQGDDIKTIIKEYPAVEVALVNESGKITLAIGYFKQNNKWKVASFGLTPDLSAISNAQQFITDSTLKKGILIRIPGLEISFIGVKSPGGMDLITLIDNTVLGLKKGDKKPAPDVLAKLATSIKKF